jgi:hypothetical protein
MTKPVQSPPNNKSARAQTGTSSRPTELPPNGKSTMTGNGTISRPRELTEEEVSKLLVAARRGTTGQRDDGVMSAADVAATVWQNSQLIGALWSINQDRNSWVYVDNIGWLKLSTASDSAIVALTMLGTHAKQLQKNVDYRQESDQMIHEMYVW